jgi:tetratricopeptide (TPR) repeat protein
LFGAHFNLATLRFNDQQYQSAIAHYVDYMVLAGESSRVHRNIGMSLVQLGEPESALISFDRALALDPTDATIYYNIAMVYEEQGNFEKTRKNLENAVDLDPYFDEAQYELAKLLKNNGQLQESISEFKRLIARSPAHYRALNGLATCYLAMKDADSAVNLLRDAIKVFPNCARTHYNLGVALRTIGEAEESRVHLLAANDIDPSYGTSHRVLGPRMSRPIRKPSLSQRIRQKANPVHAGR